MSYHFSVIDRKSHPVVYSIFCEFSPLVGLYLQYLHIISIQYCSPKDLNVLYMSQTLPNRRKGGHILTHA